MKKPLILLILLTLFSACNSDDDTNETVVTNNNPIVGQWKLTEQLLDPGDGSGTFMPIISNKTIEFYMDGTVISNGNLCTPGTNTVIGTVGTFNENQFITSSACATSLGVEYELLTNTSLLISYPCIEACQEKYIKIR
jgi:hypothetical protein